MYSVYKMLHTYYEKYTVFAHSISLYTIYVYAYIYKYSNTNTMIKNMSN